MNEKFKKFKTIVGGKVICSADFYWVKLSDRNVGVVENLFTEKSHRQQGYAKQLMEEIVSFAKWLGLDSVELCADETNGWLLKFYKDMGFEDRRNRALKLKI